MARKEGITLAVLPYYKHRYKEEYREFLAFMKKESGAWQSDIVTSWRFAYEWQRNMIRNLRHYKDSVPVLWTFGQWKDKPLIIVSSGPSLDKAIPSLKKAQGKALILSAGSSLPRLLKEGIKPDFLIAFDGGYDNHRDHFLGLDSDVPLIWDSILNSRILDTYKGPKLAMRMWPFGFLEACLGHPIGEVQIGPSIANTALDFALKLGANPIIFTGQDCCYPNGRTHAEGVHLREEAEIPIPEMVTVPGVTTPVQTSRTMVTFLHTFDHMLRGVDNLVINTSYGARIPNTKEWPIEDAVSLFCRNNLDSELFKMRSIALREPPWNLNGIKRFLKGTLFAGERLLSNISTVKLPEELQKPMYSLFGFCFHPIYCSNYGRDVAEREIRHSLEFCLPQIRECYNSYV